MYVDFFTTPLDFVFFNVKNGAKSTLGEGGWMKPQGDLIVKSLSNGCFASDHMPYFVTISG